MHPVQQEGEGEGAREQQIWARDRVWEYIAIRDLLSILMTTREGGREGKREREREGGKEGGWEGGQ